jgi:hypothetical protein
MPPGRSEPPVRRTGSDVACGFAIRPPSGRDSRKRLPGSTGGVMHHALLVH